MATAICIEPGTPELGIWCPRCALPSIIRVPLGMLTLAGYSPMAPHVSCHDCGARFCGRCMTPLPAGAPVLVCQGCRGR